MRRNCTNHRATYDRDRTALVCYICVYPDRINVDKMGWNHAEICSFNFKMSNDIWKYLSSAEGGFAAENPIEINKRMKEADSADPDKVKQQPLSEPQKYRGDKNYAGYW